MKQQREYKLHLKTIYTLVRNLKNNTCFLILLFLLFTNNQVSLARNQENRSSINDELYLYYRSMKNVLALIKVIW